MTDKRFINESGREVFTGNELLLKGGLESRMALMTGYPGSPVADVFDSIFQNRDLLIDHGILGQMANNEALSAARLNGARMANLRAVAIMKSVGMHVAADGLAIGNLAEPNHAEGGALIIVGDDPWNETTQINSDSRFLSQHLHIPILEPSTFQEVKDWMDIGFELSGASNLYVTYIVTTNQADGGASVEVKPNHYPTINFNWKTELSSAGLPIKDYVMIPPHTSQKEATLKERFERVLKLAREKNLNKILHLKPGIDKFPLGFITSGMSYCYLEHALYEMGLQGTIPMLKMGMTHPADKTIIRDFLAKADSVIVVEEKRPFLENQVRTILQEMCQASHQPNILSTRVFGKEFPFGLPGIPDVRGLNTSILIERLGALFLRMDLEGVKINREKIQAELAVIQETVRSGGDIPLRTPTFCPGCPHRDSAALSLEIKKDFSDPDFMNRNFGMDPIDVIFHGESGCHSMLQFAPNEGLMQSYSGMGIGGGTGAGIAPFVKNKQVVFLGDSTFFHSGMIAISDSIKNNQDITYIILNNDTTAMTGHQPTPGTGFDILGRKTYAQDIARVVRGMTGGQNVPVLRVNPEDREDYKKILQELILRKGVKVVISDKECGITYQRRLKKERKKIILQKGFIKKEEFINITPEVCELCLKCTLSTGCPGLTTEETDFGTKIATDLSTCVADGACAKSKVCPSFEKIFIKRKNPPRKKEFQIDPKGLPLPDSNKFPDTYYISTFAVGGMGAGIVSAILVRSGLKEGYKVSFLDKKGLAIRNGSVYGHILFSKNKNQVLAPIVPYGKADLVLGIDILETARGMDPKLNMRVASSTRTAAIVNTHKTPTILTLMGRDDFNPSELEGKIGSHVRRDRYFSIDFSEISQRALGSKLYANILLIGVAFQKGLIPISLKNLESSISESVSRQEVADNLHAFNLGREIALNPEKYSSLVSKKHPSYREIVDEKAAILESRVFNGKKAAMKYRQIVEEAIRWMRIDEQFNQKVALRVYELIQCGNIDYAQRYASILWEVYRKDRDGFAATRAVADNLFKVMAIKDEIYVAHMLTSKEKLEKDKVRYNVDESNGDRIRYVHITRPCFHTMGLKLEFDIKTRNWMLNIMKRCKFLRKLLPGWHEKEKDFREWYINIVRQFNYFRGDQAYKSYLEILKVPESVRGYREMRYPGMEEARAKTDRVLSKLKQSGEEPAEATEELPVEAPEN